MQLHKGQLGICQLALALSWLYQGLVPKLLGPHPDELAMALALNIPLEWAVRCSQAAGLGECVFAASFLVAARSAWPYRLTLLAMPLLLAYATWARPALLLAPFNPVTTNLMMAALAFIGLREMKTRQGTDKIG